MALSRSLFREIFDRLLADAVDARCAHCEFPVEERALCASCAVVSLPLGPRCERCDGTVPEPMPRCGRCLDGFLSGVDTFRSAALYAGPFRTLVVRGKTSARREWIEAAAPLVAAVADRGVVPNAVLVPVPSHRRRFAERGFNAAEVVASLLSRARDSAPIRHCLERSKFQEPLSAGASRAARHRAVQGAFVASGIAVPPIVCLVDDVLTTGATLSACARTLRRAGAIEVHAWSLLRAPDPFSLT